MSLLTLVSSQRLTVSQNGFINNLQVSTLNVSTLNWSNTVTNTILQSTLVSTTTGLQTSLVSTTLGLDTLTSVRLISTTGGLTNTIGVSASSFSTTLGNFQAGYPSTVSTSYGQSFTTGILNTSTVSFVNIQPSSSNLWVAVGIDATANNTIKYSYDGSNWSNSAGPGFSANGNGVAWNGNMWVAVGNDATQNNTIKYSFNGINWFNSAGTGFTQGIGVAWNGRYWVATGGGSFNASLKYSFNGINWSNAASGGFIDFGNSVAWNGTMWVATGATGFSLKYSYDGSNWFTGTNTFSSVGRGVAWNGRLWVAVGQDANSNNNIKYSLDGINWSNTGFGFSANGNRVAWNGNLWVATGFESSNASLKYSVDGLTWFNSVSGGFQQALASGIAWTGNFWIAMGGDNTSNARIKYSFDGINWLNSASGAFSSNGLGIAFSSNTIPSYNQNNLSILPQNIPIFITSTNTIFAQPSSLIINNTVDIDSGLNRVGINCNVPQFTMDITGTLNATGQGQLGSLGISTTQTNLWITGGTNNGTGTVGLRFSIDGCNWAQVLNVSTSFSANDIAYNGRLWIATGQVGMTNSSIVTSVDGLNWTLRGLSSFGTGSNVRWNGQYWIVAGSSPNLGALSAAPHLQRSVDGINWTFITDAFAGGGNGNAGGLAWGGDRWVAGGRSSGLANNCLRYSFNGNQWFNQTGETFVFDANFNRECLAVAWNGNTWVAVGIGSRSILYSYDGIFWRVPTGQLLTTGGGRSVAWGENKWVVVGLDSNNAGNTMVYSFDAINWQATNAIRFPRLGNKVDYNGSYWVAVGSNSNTTSNILTSFDGINWSATTNPGVNVSQIFSVAYSSNQGVLYNQPGFQILQSNIVTPLTSTHSLAMTLSTLAIDNILYINRYDDSVGVNKVAQGYSVDINGSLNTSSFFINTSSLAQVLAANAPSIPNSLSLSTLTLSTINRVLFQPISNTILTGQDTPGGGQTYMRVSLDGGSNWRNVASADFTSSANGFGYNGAYWVACGSGGTTLKYSFDGINWFNAISGAFTGAANGCAWNGKMWVAGGSGDATIKYSFDGSNWSNAASGGFTSAGIGFAWNGNMWVATGSDSTANNRIKYSYNGINWSNRVSGSAISFPFTNRNNLNILWAKDKWVLVGQVSGISSNAAIQYSFDGSNWFDSLGPSFNFVLGGTDYRAASISYNGNIFVASGVDSNNSIRYSFDAIRWFYSLGSGLSSGLDSAIWTGQYFWAYVSQSPLAVVRSFDGINWVSFNTPFTALGRGLGYSSNAALPYDQGNLQITGSNQYIIQGSWTSTSMIMPFFSSLTINETLKVDRGTFRVGINTIFPQYSLDIGGSLNTSSFFINTSSITSIIAAAASPAFPSTVSTSYSIGFTTSSLIVSTVNAINIAPPTSNILLALGSDSFATTSSIKYSYNGINWIGSAGNAFNTAGYAAAWNGNIWVAVGQDSTSNNTIKYSFNGINWLNSAGSGFGTSGYGVAWNGRMWVAVGDDNQGFGNIKYSFDGINWSNGNNVFTAAGGLGSLGRGIAWNGSLWVATGNTGFPSHRIKYSFDGITWINSSSGTSGMIEGYGVAWNGRIWIVVGERQTADENTIKHSFNGSNWNDAVSGGFNGGGRGVAWNGNMWVAVGSDSTENNRIKYSFDGLNWSNSEGSSFTSQGLGVVWNGRLWVAIGQDSTSNNTIKYSVNGINWSNSAGAGFSVGFGLAFSSNVRPTYNQNNLSILPQNIPIFLTSTNTILAQPSSLIINNTLEIDATFNRVGVNCNVPRYMLDVFGDGSFSTLTVTGGTVTTSTATSFALTVFGTQGVARVGGTTWTAISDQRVKDNITSADLDRCYSDIKNIPLRRFTYTSTFFEQYNLPDKNVLGFIAQEVSTVQPKAITVSPGFGIQDMMWLNLDQMNMSLYGATQKLMNLVEQQASTLEGQAFTIQTLVSTVQQLQNNG